MNTQGGKMKYKVIEILAQKKSQKGQTYFTIKVQGEDNKTLITNFYTDHQPTLYSTLEAEYIPPSDPKWRGTLKKIQRPETIGPKDHPSQPQPPTSTPPQVQASALNKQNEWQVVKACFLAALSDLLEYIGREKK